MIINGVACGSPSLEDCATFFRGNMSDNISSLSTSFSVEFFIYWNCGGYFCYWAFSLLKKLISCQFCYTIFFVGNTYKFCCEKRICKKLLLIFLQNILYKSLFVTNFVGNTYKFDNFVENNYPQRNCLPIKILRKNDRKKSFFANFFNKFARKNPCNMIIFSSILGS